ncbi:MAG: FUSC family protein [Bradyrhizobiaceae bacterium]|nr:FUSC family protein [Bradyrhizobiaceae bacterium]
MHANAAAIPLSKRLTESLSANGEPLLFGLRLWASVCLALFVAFWLQLDDPFWAGTSAAIVSQPQLGASLRKGWFRMVGTVVGAIVIVVLTAFFPQDRIAYLGFLALWCSICAFGASVLRNFASYAAALSGYTAAIVGVGTLGATGGASPDVFMLAITRTTEICIGIVSAGIVLAGTDLGGAQRRLAATLADLATGIMGRFSRMLALAGPGSPDAQIERREFIKRVIALDPMIDQAIGESSHLHYRSPTLQTAVLGLFRALDGWRGVATHLERSSGDMDRHDVEAILRIVPPELRLAQEPGSPALWMDDPIALRAACAGAVRRLLAQPVATPSLQLLVDETVKVLSGMLQVLDALALLVDAPGQALPDNRGFRLSVPDFLPALVNSARAFVMTSAAALFWVGTAWPSGALTMEFVAIVLVLISPLGDQAYLAAIGGVVATVGCVILAAIVKFAVLPAFDTFPAFCGAIGLILVPVGFATARSKQLAPVFALLAFNFVAVLAPTNVMSYDTTQFYNTSLGILAGVAVGALGFRLLPQLSPALRTRRLLALTLRDLRRLASATLPPGLKDWGGRMIGRLAAVPDQAEPLQRARLLAALSVGNEIFQLRDLAPGLGTTKEVATAFEALAQGHSATAVALLGQLDRRLARSTDAEPEAAIALRMRARIGVVTEALSEHRSYFDTGAAA